MITDRPEGSFTPIVVDFTYYNRPGVGGPPDDRTTPTAKFFVQMPGTYRIELRVTDESGVIAPSEMCPTPLAQVEITARPDSDIHLQLTWDTPGDPDQTDLRGADVDLHFLHPLAPSWFGVLGREGGHSWDCYFANPAPDWGVMGEDDDDPSLDLDDTNGSGPEVINLNNPEQVGAYRIGVHYYRAQVGQIQDGNTYGPSTARVRIYFGGELAHEMEQRLEDSNAFWEAARVSWSDEGPEVEEVNALSVLTP